jgi:thiamine pyrophosphate-dependent acetolactate synthase large subunit-like protein
MSIFSNFLKKKIGIPEVDLSKLPLGSLLIEELSKNGVKQVFSALSDDDMKIIDKAVQIEIYHRQVRQSANKAGIGKGYE